MMYFQFILIIIIKVYLINFYLTDKNYDSDYDSDYDDYKCGTCK